MRYRNLSGSNAVDTWFSPTALSIRGLISLSEKNGASAGTDITGLSTFNPGHRSLQRKLVGSASTVEPEETAGFSFPQTLRQVAGLEKRVCYLDGQPLRDLE